MSFGTNAFTAPIAKAQTVISPQSAITAAIPVERAAAPIPVIINAPIAAERIAIPPIATAITPSFSYNFPTSFGIIAFAMPNATPTNAISTAIPAIRTNPVATAPAIAAIPRTPERTPIAAITAAITTNFGIIFPTSSGIAKLATHIAPAISATTPAIAAISSIAAGWSLTLSITAAIAPNTTIAPAKTPNFAAKPSKSSGIAS